jgi:hypothetical protein
LDSGGTGALKLVAQVLLKGTADAVLAASVFEFGECTVRDVEESCAKERHTGAFMRRLYELLFKSPACWNKSVCALLFCVAAMGFGSSESFFSLDIYFHK